MSGKSGGQSITIAPKLAGVTLQSSVQGLPVPIIYGGGQRVSVNIIDTFNFVAMPVRESQGGGGGKGLGGGGGTTSVSWTYSTGVLYAIGEGPIYGIGTVYESSSRTTIEKLGLTEFDGNYNQGELGWLTVNQPSHALNYRGLAYLATSSMPLGASTSLPNLSLEVQGIGGVDLCATDIMYDLLTSPHYGCSAFPPSAIGAWTQAKNACAAQGITLAPAYTSQQSLATMFTDLCDISGLIPYFSEGKFKLTPRCDQSLTGSIPALGYSNTEIKPSPSYWLSDGCHTGDMWVLVGYQVIYISPDLATFISRPCPAYSYTAVCSDGHAVVACCSAGWIVSYSNGVTWSPLNPWSVSTGNNINSIVFGNGHFVATSPSYVYIGFYTGNGTLKFVAYAASGVGGLSVSALIYDGVNFVAFGSSGSAGYIKYSSTGITWNNSSFYVNYPSSGFYGMVCAWGTLYALYGVPYSSVNLIRSFDNGQSWQTYTNNLPTNFNVTYQNLAFDDEKLYVIALGSPSKIYTSLDGITWTAYTLSTPFAGSPDNNFGYDGQMLFFQHPPTSSYGFFRIQAAIASTGYSYTPNLTPIYSLGDDDFIVNGNEPPVRITRNSQADVYNKISLTIQDRTNNYNQTVFEAFDAGSVNQYGLIPQSNRTFPQIVDPAVGRKVAQLLLQVSQYVRNQYEFSLSWKYCLIEPTDILAITDTMAGLNGTLCRVVTVEEDGQGLLKITAESLDIGVGSIGGYAAQATSGTYNDPDADPGNISSPVVFQPPLDLTNNVPQIWIGVSGGRLWGGCQVWVSYDDASYSLLGTITAPAIYGQTTTTLPAVSDPDISSTLGIDTSSSGGELLSVNQSVVDSLNSLIYLDGEIIGYRDAVLTGANAYNLSYLRRGLFNSGIYAHASGVLFMRLDSQVGKFDVGANDAGSTLYIKLCSFNVFGNGLQDISNIQPIQYVVQPVGMAPMQGNINTIPSGQYLAVNGGSQYTVSGLLTLKGRLKLNGRLILS